MIYKAIIIEDEENAANLLEEILKNTHPEIQVIEKCRDIPSGVISIRRNAPYVVFLDIELPVYNGIQILEFFKPEEVNFKIIFTTAYSQYALMAFELCAIDYLMKPIQEIQLSKAIDKLTKTNSASIINTLPVLQHNLADKTNRKIVLPVSNGFEILNVADICYLKAEGSYTRIFFTTHTSMLASRNLKHFQFILEGMGDFFRIHRSIMVNMHFATRVYRSDNALLILKDKTELPVANEKIDALLEYLRNM